MKCPKCGFTSFDYVDRCKSCGEDLVPTKIKLNISSKPPKLAFDDSGFVMAKVGTANAQPATETLLADGIGEETLESFDFEDKNA